jgi:hypothetical protein
MTPFLLKPTLLCGHLPCRRKYKPPCILLFVSHFLAARRMALCADLYGLPNPIGFDCPPIMKAMYWIKERGGSEFQNSEP